MIDEITKHTYFKKLTELSFVEEIYLYGSRARKNNFSTRADIDLAIYCPNASEKDWLHIVDIFDNADTLLHIDFIRYDSLKEDDKLKINIDEEKHVLFSRLHKI